MVREFDLDLGDARTLHAYDAGGDGERLAVFWHHGTPNIGAPPAPLFADADRLGLRWVSYDRPGYGGSTPQPGRDVASAATRSPRRSQTRSTSSGSRSWGTPAARPTRSRAAHACPTVLSRS
jgi:pimeloyl-ACP methyl ester carboxylesterase